MNINEHIIKLTGRASLPDPLEISKTYTIQATGDITNISDNDNQNGTIDRSYKFEPLTVELITDHGKVELKKKSPHSIQLRTAHWKWQQQYNSDLTYEQMMPVLLSNYDEFMTFLIERNNE